MRNEITKYLVLLVRVCVSFSATSEPISLVVLWRRENRNHCQKLIIVKSIWWKRFLFFFVMTFSSNSTRTPETQCNQCNGFHHCNEIHWAKWKRFSSFLRRKNWEKKIAATFLLRFLHPFKYLQRNSRSVNELNVMTSIPFSLSSVGDFRLPSSTTLSFTFPTSRHRIVDRVNSRISFFGVSFSTVWRQWNDADFWEFNINRKEERFFTLCGPSAERAVLIRLFSPCLTLCFSAWMIIALLINI